MWIAMITRERAWNRIRGSGFSFENVYIDFSIYWKFHRERENEALSVSALPFISGAFDGVRLRIFSR
jgi:hypothetical protein